MCSSMAAKANCFACHWSRTRANLFTANKSNNKYYFYWFHLSKLESCSWIAHCSPLYLCYLFDAFKFFKLKFFFWNQIILRGKSGQWL
jgi:hypothetical protein